MSNDSSVRNRRSPDGEWPVIWIEPHCENCVRGFYSGEGPTWCQDDVYEPCEECGKRATKYVIAVAGAQSDG